MLPTRFDAHCHVFNLEYLLLEAADMLFHEILGQYPHSTAKTLTKTDNDTDRSPQSQLQRIKGFITWLKDLIDACRDSEEENLNTVLGAARAGWNDGLPVSSIPLMMDIYYMFAPILPQGPAPVEAESRAESMPFDDAVKQLESLLQELKIPAEHVELIRQKITERKNVKALDTLSYFDTWGFAHHRKALEALKAARPNDLYPFFAVDPRRPGVVDAVISGNIVGKDRSFQGVKLYPRLGYHPACAALDPLFRWCSENHIPIITHCGPGGFPPDNFTPPDHDQLGLPANFDPVLERYPNLIIDFAHFGSSCTAWAEEVADRIEKYENVYSDLACYTVDHRIPNFKAAFWNRPKVQERTMFGTDFDVFYFTAVSITLEKYYSFFKAASNPGAFTDAELIGLSSTVPEQFLSSVR